MSLDEALFSELQSPKRHARYLGCNLTRSTGGSPRIRFLIQLAETLQQEAKELREEFESDRKQSRLIESSFSFSLTRTTQSNAGTVPSGQELLVDGSLADILGQCSYEVCLSET